MKVVVFKTSSLRVFDFVLCRCMKVTTHVIRSMDMDGILGRQVLTSVACLRTTFVRVPASMCHPKERDLR